jgi:hypothetical protein
MRPRELDFAIELALIKVFEKVKADMKKASRCNQFQIANQMKLRFLNVGRISSWNGDRFLTHLELRDLELDGAILREAAIDYFQIEHSEVWALASYLRRSTPAAIVQKLKRLKRELEDDYIR